jgi:hypothetical protein
MPEGMSGGYEVRRQSGGFNRAEIARVQKMVADHQDRLLEAWNEYFHGGD